MFCKKLILVNWGNIPSQEIEFGPINLFSGGNGSGKTTAADALQSLMTAAHENLFNFNPGQDETTQRGRGGKQVRTLASYVLGCDDGSYARPRTTDGYIGAVFHPTQGEEGERFSVVMCMRASLDTAGQSRQARLDQLQFLILPDEALSLEELIRADKSGKYITPLDDLPRLLSKQFGANSVESYDKKGPYLRRLYALFRGERGALSDREAKHAARTFSNFMAYKPVRSIHDFVAREVLEPKDLSEDIRQVSELMKTIHTMESETRRINSALENLSDAKTAAQIYIDNWSEHCLLRYADQIRIRSLNQQQYLQLKKQQNACEQQLQETHTRIDILDGKRDVLQQAQVDMLAQRQGIAALKNKDSLEADVAQHQKALAELTGPLLNEDQKISRNVSHASAILNLGYWPDDLPITLNQIKKPLQALCDAGADTQLDAASLQTRDWIDNSALEHRLHNVLSLQKPHNAAVSVLHDGEPSLAQQLWLSENKKREQCEKLRAQAQLKQREMDRLENQHTSYPPAVEAALDAIRQQCPEAQPAVLCEFVDISDPEWQMAIEGYLGGARFGIVVDSDYEAEAIRIVRSLGGRRNTARVLQASRAARDAARFDTPKGSILEVMHIDHKAVEHYLRASYGSVLRVANAEALKHTARGLTPDGLGSGNYSLFRCDIDDSDLVFGAGARSRALEAKRRQLQQLEIQAQAAANTLDQLKTLRQHVEGIQSINCGDLIHDMLEHARLLQVNEQRLNQLDLSDFNELESQLDTNREDLRALAAEANTLREEAGKLKESLAQGEKVIQRLSREQDHLQEACEQAEAQVEALARRHTELKLDTLLPPLEQEAAERGNRDYASEIQEALTQCERQERVLYERLLEHNRNTAQYSSIQFEMRNTAIDSLDNLTRVLSTQGEIERVHHSLRNNVLAGKHEKLLSLRDSFNTTFVSSLCHSIYQSINEGQRTLDELNTELEHHRFGADRERFYFAYEWVPEFREYWRFFEELIQSPSLGDGQTLFDAELSAASTKVRDHLLEMLLDRDEQHALNELRRISDYRNYRHYEIFKEPEGKQPIALSTYGTGSGGQLETPAYIIRSAAITSAFRFNEGRSHCRMVLVDEAFSKMDETRSREVIHYLTETLGLQLIFIMPSSKSGPFLDLISHQVVFSKCPAQTPVGELKTRVLVDRKVCNQEKIRSLWANHRRTLRQQAQLDFMEGLVEST